MYKGVDVMREGYKQEKSLKRLGKKIEIELQNLNKKDFEFIYIWSVE